MSYKHHISPDLSLGVLRVSGTMPADELLEALSALYTDEAWQPGFSTLWDGRDLEGLYVLPKDLDAFRERSAALAERQGAGKIAVVVNRQSHAEIAEVLLLRRGVKQRPSRVFRDMRTALDWLGLADLPPEVRGE